MRGSESGLQARLPGGLGDGRPDRALAQVNASPA
jgi:hypothetical protein